MGQDKLESKIRLGRTTGSVGRCDAVAIPCGKRTLDGRDRGYRSNVSPGDIGDGGSVEQVADQG
jgi:hypothetical protein